MLVNEGYAASLVSEDAETDTVDRLVAQWGPERPDLDLGTMATVARLVRLGQTLAGLNADMARSYGLDPAEGDVLFTLRRAGPPYRLTPARVSQALLVSSGTLTSRLDRLEAQGLIARVPHPTDRRSVEIQLTDRARKMVDEAVTAHVANEQRMLAVLGEEERAELDGLARRLLAHLDSGAWRDEGAQG
jgi:DNA-binding MarR family transcriptional regulator